MLVYALCLDEVEDCAGHHTSAEQFLRAIGTLSPLLQSAVWLKENSFLFQLCAFHWPFLWTLELIWSSGTLGNVGCKAQDPTQACSLPVLLHDLTPHSLHLTWDTPVCEPPSWAVPQPGEGSLTSLMSIQATQTLNKHCALFSLEQLMGEDKGDVTWPSSRSSVAGRAEHRDREVILDMIGEELCSARRKAREQEVEWWGGDGGTGKRLTILSSPSNDPQAKTLSTNQQHGS